MGTLNDKMGTESVRIDTTVVGFVRKIKESLGYPIGRFIEEAILEKANRLTKKQKEKAGLIKVLKK